MYIYIYSSLSLKEPSHCCNRSRQAIPFLPSFLHRFSTQSLSISHTHRHRHRHKKPPPPHTYLIKSQAPAPSRPASPTAGSPSPAVPAHDDAPASSSSYRHRPPRPLVRRCCSGFSSSRGERGRRARRARRRVKAVRRRDRRQGLSLMSRHRWRWGWLCGGVALRLLMMMIGIWLMWDQASLTRRWRSLLYSYYSSAELDPWARW